MFTPSSCRYDWSAEPPLLSSRARICWAYWQSLLSRLWSCGLHRCEGPVQCSLSEPECSRIMFPNQTLKISEFRTFVGWRNVSLLNISSPWVGVNVLSGQKLTDSDRLSIEGPFAPRKRPVQQLRGLPLVGIRTPASLIPIQAWSKRKLTLRRVACDVFFKG